jgi:hypothetical protein
MSLPLVKEISVQIDRDCFFSRRSKAQYLGGMALRKLDALGLPSYKVGSARLGSIRNQRWIAGWLHAERDRRIWTRSLSRA